MSYKPLRVGRSGTQPRAKLLSFRVLLTAIPSSLINARGRLLLQLCEFLRSWYDIPLLSVE